MKILRFLLTWLVALSLSPVFAAQPTGGVNLHGALPLDVAGTTWQAVGGIAALTKNLLQGPLFDVIDHSGNTVTINAKNGYPDVKKLAGLMGISPKVGISGLLCSKVYDQTGTGNHWIQATTANQPAIWLVNGNVYLFFGGILSTNAQNGNASKSQFFSYLNGALLQNLQSASISAIINPYSTFDAVVTSEGAPSITGTTGSYLWAPGLGFDANNPNAGFFDFNTFTGPSLSDTQVTIQQSLLSLVLSPSAATLWLNETSNATAAATVATAAYQQWGDQPGAPVSSAFSGRQMALMLSANALATTQASQVRSMSYQWANIKSLPSAGFVNVVIAGASIDEGQGGDATGLYSTQNGGGYGWGEMIKDYLQQRGYAVQFNNAATAGGTIAYEKAIYIAATNTLYNPAAKKNIYFGFNSGAGNTINDVGSFTATIATTVMNVTAAPNSLTIPLQVGQIISGAGVTANTTIASFGTGSGGTGTYNLNLSSTVASGETMQNTATGLSAYNDFLSALASVKAQPWDVIVTYLFADAGPDALHDYNVLMLANANANGIKIIQLQPSNNPSINPDSHPTITGYQGYYGNIIPQLLPMLFN